MGRILLLILFLAFISGACHARKGEDAMNITSPVFADNGPIPAKYTCQGEDINPPLAIRDIPEGTKSLALIVDDPDAPKGTWVHWVVFNIPPVLTEIKEDSIPGRQGSNDFRRNDYGGPCPPSGTHRYFFKLYALDTKLDRPEGITKEELESAMEGHIIQEAQLIGLYKRK